MHHPLQVAVVAERLEKYHALGIDHVLLSGQPHLEEAYWFAEGAGRLLRQRGVVAAVGSPRSLAG